MKTSSEVYVGVVGPGDDATKREIKLAFEVGSALAKSGFIVVTGGLSGVMEAACKGAFKAGGITLGLLPTDSRNEANSYLTVSVPTGIGEMRNALVVRTSAVLISIGGSWGTLSEISLACRIGVPVYSLEGWDLPFDGPIKTLSPLDAIEKVTVYLDTLPRF